MQKAYQIHVFLSNCSLKNYFFCTENHNFRVRFQQAIDMLDPQHPDHAPLVNHRAEVLGRAEYLVSVKKSG